MNYLLRHILLLLMVALPLAGCIREYYSLEEENISGDKVQIEIFTRANSYHTPVMRGLSEENIVGMTPWVLVFIGSGDNAVFAEAVQAFELVGKRYVILSKQTVPCRLLILANPQSKFHYGMGDASGSEFTQENLLDKITPGSTTLSDVCSKLLTEPIDNLPMSFPFAEVGETIPMSYLLDIPNINEDTKIAEPDNSSLQLIRIVAKMEVINKATNFRLEGISSVMNAPKQGQLHRLVTTDPLNNDNQDLVEYHKNDGYITDVVSAETIVLNEQTTENSPIYLFESKSGTAKDTYIIVRGKYYEGLDGRNNEIWTEYFYKMALVDITQNSLNILRNHQYKFIITEVRGRGYNSVEDAKVSKPSNIDLNYTIKVIDPSSYEIIANNDYYLGVSNSLFLAYTNVDETYDAFTLVTNCTRNFPYSRDITPWNSWTGNATTDFVIADPTDSKIPITDNLNTPIEYNVKVMIRGDMPYDDNNGPEQYIILMLGNIEKKVYVRRRNAISVLGEIFKVPDTYGDFSFQSGLVIEKEAKEWIKLAPGPQSSDIRNDADNIVVDNNEIYVHVLPNISPTGDGIQRTGTIYLTTNRSIWWNPGSTFRIKVSITQLGN